LVYTYIELLSRANYPNDAREFAMRLKRKFQEKGDVEYARDHLSRLCGIELADQLSIEHINMSL